MKTIELIAEMQKNLTALKEQHVNEVSELEVYKAKQREKAKQLETSILSALAAFLHEDEATTPEPVESPAEDKETASAEAKRMEEEAEAALKQAKELAEKEATEKKRKADIAEAKVLAAKAKAEQEENERKERAAVAERALKEAADRKAAEDAAKEAAAKEAATKEAAVEDEPKVVTGDDSKLEKLLDKYQHPITLRAIENLKANGHEAMLKPSRNKMGWFCRSVEANKLILDETERIVAEEQKALFADGSGAEQHLKEIGAFAMARKKASTFGRQSAIMDKFPVTLDGIDKSQHMEKLGTTARMCMLGKLFSSDQFKEYLEPYGLTSMAQLPIDKVNEFYQHMLTSCMYNVDKEQD